MMYQNPHIVQALDYSRFFLQDQNYIANRSRKQLSFYWYWIPAFLTDFFSVNELVKKVNSKLAAQLLSSKGLLAELKEKQHELKVENISSTISALNEFIKINIKLHSSIQEIKIHDTKNKYFELKKSESILAETIEYLYDIERLLKRANKIIPIETSELARSAALHSTNSLKKALYGR